MPSALWLAVFGGALVVLSTMVAVFRQQINRLLKIYYERLYGGRFARLTSVGAVLAWAIAVFAFGGTILILAILHVGAD